MEIHLISIPLVLSNRALPFLAKTNRRNLLVRSTHYRFDESTDISSSTATRFTATRRSNLIHHLVNNHNRFRLAPRSKKKKKKKREKRKTEKRKNISRVKSLARPTSRTGDGGNLRRLTRDFSRCSVAELRPNCHSSGGPRRIIVRVSAVNRCPPRDTPLKVGERLRRA